MFSCLVVWSLGELLSFIHYSTIHYLLFIYQFRTFSYQLTSYQLTFTIHYHLSIIYLSIQNFQFSVNRWYFIVLLSFLEREI